jgi:hypothetical protein
VELWGLRAGEGQWRLFATDSDNRSPVAINIGEEGIYGFRLVVRQGSASQPPQPGESPELWIGIDCTPPVVRFGAVQEVPTAEGGAVVICWEASDQAMAPRPITILFSDHAAGPWTVIAAGLENSGRYHWLPDARAPRQLYFRIEARDEAGNVGTSETQEPLVIQQARSPSRIREVRPLSQTGRSEPGVSSWR